MPSPVYQWRKAFLLNISGGLLVLLIFRDQIVHVGFSFSELHFVHAFSSVPMEESLSPEHGSELFGDTFEDLLDGGGITHESGGHLETTRRDVTHGGFHIVGNPFNEIGGIFVLDVQDLFINFLHGHPSSENSSHGEISSMPGVTGSHHVLGIEHLLGELWDGDCSVLLGAPGGQGGEPWHEEVEPGEGDHVNSQLPQVSVELAREPEAGGDT